MSKKLPEVTSQLEKNLVALPSMCATMHPTEDYPIIIKRGECGYFPAKLLRTSVDVKKFNDNFGITEEQVMAMSAGSMFGWQVPGAHPDAWKGKKL